MRTSTMELSRLATPPNHSTRVLEPHIHHPADRYEVPRTLSHTLQILAWLHSRRFLLLDYQKSVAFLETVARQPRGFRPPVWTIGCVALATMSLPTVIKHRRASLHNLLKLVHTRRHHTAVVLGARALACGLPCLHPPQRQSLTVSIQLVVASLENVKVQCTQCPPLLLLVLPFFACLTLSEECRFRLVLQRLLTAWCKLCSSNLEVDCSVGEHSSSSTRRTFPSQPSLLALPPCCFSLRLVLRLFAVLLPIQYNLAIT
mmetsp:Transcript_18738/g.33911  ORF Transcript_18738/g.33911 Transcript_18738/m.33911 type:complete len:259 (-) Transcript_18738:275-1051(-)